MELKQHENWKRSVDVEVPVEVVQRHIDGLVQKYQRRMSLPGFRKGKAPESLVRSTLSDSLDQEVLDLVLPESFAEALRHAGVDPDTALRPRVEDLHYHAGQPLRFTAFFEVRPSLEPRDYKGLELTQEVTEVGEEDVARILEDLRQRSAEYPVSEAPAGLEAVVIVDYDARDEAGQPVADGKRHDYPLELGARGLLPEFRDGLLGARAGEGRTLTVDYPAEFGNPKLAGRKVRYDMKIKEVREKKLPELDDNFASTRFGAKDLEDFRTRIRLRLEGEERFAARERLEAAVAEEVVRRNDFAPPESMVEDLLDRLVERAREENKEVSDEDVARVRTEYRPAAERSVKRQLLWEALARAEKLAPSKEEMDAEVTRIVQAGAAEAQAEGRGAPDEAVVRTPRNLARIEDALTDRKVYEFLVNAAQVKTVSRPRASQPASS
ncbi:MAG: trigger factor [Candidatus Eisenbacteria bacterium]|nr:trigger factor [Candidatus Eisenbacteria bacterium]